MKRITLFFTLFIFFFSLGAMAKIVDLKDARQAGKNFYFERANMKSVILPYSSIRITGEFVESENALPALYIFNINDNGFVIVAAEDASFPVLGYSFESTYTDQNEPDNFRWLLDSYKREINWIRESNLSQDQTLKKEWSRLLVDTPMLPSSTDAPLEVLPLISNDWNQDFPYNALCPEDPACTGSYQGRVPVGCVATAMTQIMYYWRYPDVGQGTKCIFPVPSYGPQCADFGATTYYWDGMAQKPSKECDPVAILSWHGGISVNMDYECDGSASYTSRVETALKNYFKYSSSLYYQDRPTGSLTNWKNQMRAELDAKRPLEYSGSDAGGGHAWVCDGYQDNDYFHFNFGWGGQDNGYYLITNVNPGGYTFNSGQGCVFGIQPNPLYYPANCSGTKTITGYDFGTFEDGSGPVADYLNNVNCSWLIDPHDSVATITLSFVRFSTEVGDEVKIYDGASASAPLLATYSGSSIPASVTSTGPKMFVTFSTGSSGTAPGWLAAYSTTVVPFCSSSTTITESGGDLTDGSESYRYRNSTTCMYKLLPTNAATVTFTLDSFSSEPTKDKLQVYDSQNNQLLVTYTGEYTTLPGPVTSPSGKMMLVWQSNNTVRGNGWKGSYSITVGKDEERSFEKLNVYPNPADNKLTVSFEIALPQDITIELHAMKGDLIFSDLTSNFSGLFEKTFDVSNLAKGIYLLRITGDQGISTRKIVVE